MYLVVFFVGAEIIDILIKILSSLIFLLDPRSGWIS